MLINIKYATKPKEVTSRVAEISEIFGIGINEAIEHTILDGYDFKEDFEVCYITGCSGSGKSSLLRALKEQYGYDDLGLQQAMNEDKAIIDLIGSDTKEAIGLLSICGLAEAKLFVKRPFELSDGQKYRFQLAWLLDQKRNMIMIDEFTSFLDRTTASVVAFNIQKICRRNNIKLIVATAHNDLEEFLKPDVKIDFKTGDEVETTYKEVTDENPFIPHLTIEDGTKQDFDNFIKYHYKNVKAVPGQKKVYRLMYDGQPIGLAVYAVASRMLSGRNTYFNKHYMHPKGYPLMDKVNSDFISASRFIIHPQYRGCGLGAWFTRETVKLMDKEFGKPFIEFSSVMAKYTPFLQKGGVLDICDNESEKSRKDTNKVKAILEKYGFSYEFLTSLDYCQKVIDTIPEKELRKAFRGRLRTAMFIRHGLDLDVAELDALELTPKLLAEAKKGETRYLLHINEDKCTQCPNCGRWHVKEDDCYFCGKEE